MKLKSFASTMNVGRSLTSATVGMKLYRRRAGRHSLSSVINTALKHCSCGLNDTWKIHYSSDFQTM